MMIVDIPLITRRTARGGRHRPPKNSRLDVLSRQIDDDDRIIPYCAPHFSGQKTAIEVMVRPDEGTRTPNSACVWIAEATVDGRVYTARSRHGATNELARQLAAAGLADRPMVIRCRGLAGTLSYRSFHAAAKWTYKEGDRPLRRVRYKERPEGFSLASVLDQNAFHRRWTMAWRSRRPRAMKRRRRHQQPRCAAATDAVAISSPPAPGRAFAHPLADCGRIADLPEIQEPRNQPQFPRALSHRPPYPPIGPLSPYSMPPSAHRLARVRARVSRGWSQCFFP